MTTDTTTTTAAIEALLKDVTPGPWVYRPDKYSDWGTVYAGDCHLLQARHPERLSAEILDEYRAAKIDPWQENARFIAAARDLVPALAAERDAALRERDEAEFRETLAATKAVEYLDRAEKSEAEAAALRGEVERLKGLADRKKFPILGERGVSVDWQLVADHGGQANTNHGQTVARLAERGGLSWCELFAVLHNRRWEKMDKNDAMIACRALETRYLAALTSKGGEA